MNNQVILGRFGSPYGVKGWIKVFSYTDPIEKILEYFPWYFFKAGTMYTINKVKGKRHGDKLIVQIDHCQDREMAKTYTNIEIFVDREQLPPLPEQEYYWVDLVGLTVVNQEGITLGKVESLFSTGSNDVLIVKDATENERLIPYTMQVILDVDLQNKTLRVDWDATF